MGIFSSEKEPKNRPTTDEDFLDKLWEIRHNAVRVPEREKRIKKRSRKKQK